MNFTLKFIYLVVYFVASRNVAQIRNIFIRVQMIDAAKNASMFASGSFGQNPIGEFEAQQAPNPNVNTASMEVDLTYKRLNALNKRQLDQIAQQLSISGYEAMDKKELTKIIYSIYKSMESEKTEMESESEAVKDPENKKNDHHNLDE